MYLIFLGLRDLRPDLPWRPPWCGKAHRKSSPCFLPPERRWSPPPSAPRRRWSWIRRHCGKQARLDSHSPQFGAAAAECSGNKATLRLTPWAWFLQCWRCSPASSGRRACRIPECRTAGPGSWRPGPGPPCSRGRCSQSTWKQPARGELGWLVFTIPDVSVSGLIHMIKYQHPGTTQLQCKSSSF